MEIKNKIHTSKYIKNSTAHRNSNAHNSNIHTKTHTLSQTHMQIHAYDTDRLIRDQVREYYSLAQLKHHTFFTNFLYEVNSYMTLASLKLTEIINSKNERDIQNNEGCPPNILFKPT